MTLSNLVVQEAAYSDVRGLLLNHYRRDISPGCFIWTVAIENDTPLAVAGFGKPKPSMAGGFWLPPWKHYGPHHTIELKRLWTPDDAQLGMGSWFMNKSLAFIPKQHSHEPAFDLVISYADPAFGHTGTQYRGAGWLDYGQNTAIKNDYVWVDENGREYNKRGPWTEAKKRGAPQGTIEREAHKIAEARGWTKVPRPGKYRFAKSLNSFTNGRILLP